MRSGLAAVVCGLVFCRVRRFFQLFIHPYFEGSGGERRWALYGDGGNGGEL